MLRLALIIDCPSLDVVRFWWILFRVIQLLFSISSLYQLHVMFKIFLKCFSFILLHTIIMPSCWCITMSRGVLIYPYSQSFNFLDSNIEFFTVILSSKNDPKRNWMIFRVSWIRHILIPILPFIKFSLLLWFICSLQ